MKKILITFYLLLFTSFLFSQTSVVYNNLYNTIATSIKELPNGNFVFCQQYLNDVELTVINENGIKQDSLIFDKINISYYFTYDAIEVKDNKIYLLLMETDYTNTTKYLLSLSCFNLNLDTIWNKKYFVDTTSIYGNTFCKTSDGGFAISGNIYINEKNTAFILKTDSIGETQWYKEYGNSNKNEVITKIIQNENNDYILSGYNYVYTNQKKWYLIRTDSIGNFIWDWTINNPYVTGSDLITDLIETQDSNYIAIGYQIYNDDVPGYGNVYNAHLIKFDINKNILSDRIYYEPLRIEQSPTDTSLSLFQKIVQKPNGNFLVIGEKQYAVNWDLTENQTFIYELNTDLDVIRKIKYSPTACKLHGTNPMGLINCNDGSLAFISNTDAYIEAPNQRVWFVKTDTNYCDGFGACDTVMNIYFYSEDTVSKTDTLNFKFQITSNIDIPYEVWLGFYHKNYSYCCDGEVLHNVSINTMDSIKISYDKLVAENTNSSTPVGDTIYIRSTIWPSSCSGRAEYFNDELFTLVFTEPDSGIFVPYLEKVKNKISIYPNPTKDNVQLVISNEQLNKNTSVYIYDVYGREVKQFKIKNSKFKINVSDLEKGVYFVKIGEYSTKFIKK